MEPLIIQRNDCISTKYYFRKDPTGNSLIQSREMSFNDGVNVYVEYNLTSGSYNSTIWLPDGSIRSVVVDIFEHSMRESHWESTPFCTWTKQHGSEHIDNLTKALRKFFIRSRG